MPESGPENIASSHQQDTSASRDETVPNDEGPEQAEGGEPAPPDNSDSVGPASPDAIEAQPSAERISAFAPLSAAAWNGVQAVLRGLSEVDIDKVDQAAFILRQELERRADRDLAAAKFKLESEKYQSEVAFERQRRADEQERHKTELKLRQDKFEADQKNLELERDHQKDLKALEVQKEKDLRELEVQKEKHGRELEARQVSAGEKVRSIVLYLVVLAIVATPLVIMILAIQSPDSAISPQNFTQYIAPVTAIAGTILGYWFGRESQK